MPRRPDIPQHRRQLLGEPIRVVPDRRAERHSALASAPQGIRPVGVAEPHPAPFGHCQRLFGPPRDGLPLGLCHERHDAHSQFVGSGMSTAKVFFFKVHFREGTSASLESPLNVAMGQTKNCLETKPATAQQLLTERQLAADEEAKDMFQSSRVGYLMACSLQALWLCPVAAEDAGARALPGTGDYVAGPYQTHGQVVATTDVRTLGCPQCDPVPRILATADFNADGLPEFVLTFESFDLTRKPIDVPTQMAIVSADGKPYPGIIALPARVHPREAVVADFNGDGIDDLFAAAQGPDGRPFPGEQNVLLLSQGAGRLEDVSFTNLPIKDEMAHGAAAGDIDGDGDLDLIVVTNAGGGRAKLETYFLINDGTGKFNLSPGSAHLPAGPSRKRNYFLTARFSDINQDGNVDLMMAGSADMGQNSLLLYGDGTGNFRDSNVKLPRSPFGTKAYTTDIDVVDLDGDGDKDVILLNCAIIGKQVFKGLYIQTLINDGGKFQDETGVRIWGQDWPAPGDFAIPHNLTLADLNGDGAPDFVVQSLNPVWNKTPGDVPAQIGINDGHGHFNPVTPEWLDPSEGHRARELLPALSGDHWIIAGESLFGEPTATDFRTYGQRLTIFR